jgi:hypothetical protein
VPRRNRQPPHNPQERFAKFSAVRGHAGASRRMCPSHFVFIAVTMPLKIR